MTRRWSSAHRSAISYDALSKLWLVECPDCPFSHYRNTEHAAVLTAERHESAAAFEARRAEASR